MGKRWRLAATGQDAPRDPLLPGTIPCDMMSQSNNRLVAGQSSGKQEDHSPHHQTLIEQIDYSTFLQTLGANLQREEDSPAPRTEQKTITMSGQGFSHFQSHSFSSSTFTTSRNGEAPQTWKSSETTSRNPQGTTIHRTSEQPGQLPTQERLQLDAQGKPMLGQQQERGRIEDVSEADKEYLERMEEEYAKREGGA